MWVCECIYVYICMIWPTQFVIKEFSQNSFLPEFSPNPRCIERRSCTYPTNRSVCETGLRCRFVRRYIYCMHSRRRNFGQLDHPKAMNATPFFFFIRSTLNARFFHENQPRLGLSSPNLPAGLSRHISQLHKRITSLHIIARQSNTLLNSLYCHIDY